MPHVANAVATTGQTEFENILNKKLINIKRNKKKTKLNYCLLIVVYF